MDLSKYLIGLSLLSLLLLGRLQAQNGGVAMLPDSAEARTALPEGPMSLEACIRFALRYNPNVRRARLDEVSNRYQVKEVLADGLPQVNGSAGFRDNFSLPQQILPGEFLGRPGEQVPVTFGVRYNFSTGVEVSQLLFNKSFFTGLKAARSSQELFQLQTVRTKEDLTYNVAQVYLQLQITERQLEILEANLERVTRLLDITRVQLEEGVVKKVDVDQLRVNQTNIKTEIQNTRIALDQQLKLLKFYMGVGVGAEVQVENALEQEPEFALAARLNLNNNTQLQILDKQLELNQLDLENIRAGYYPKVSAFANYGYTGQTDVFTLGGEEYTSFTNGVWGINVDIPIFDGFRKSNRVQQNLVRQEQVRLDYQRAALRARMEFDNANEQLRQNRALIEQQEANMNLAEELYNITKLSYQEGVAPLTELLNAENSLKEAQTQYLTALLQKKLAELDHLRASGRLTQIVEQQSN